MPSVQKRERKRLSLWVSIAYCHTVLVFEYQLPSHPQKISPEISFDVGKTSLPFRYLADKCMFVLRLEFVVADHVAGRRMGFVMSDVEMA